MNSKKNHRGKAGNLFVQILIAVIVIAVMIGAVELFFNFKTMTLPAEQKGITEIPLETVGNVGYEMTDAGLYRNADAQDASNLHIDFDGKYIDKLAYSYQYGALLDMHVRVVSVNKYGVEETEDFLDKNNAVLCESVINIKKNVKYIELYTDDNLLLEDGIEYLDLKTYDLTITKIETRNVSHANTTRMLLVLLAGCMIAMLVIFRGFFFKRLEFAFLLVSVTVGIMMILVMPASKTGWDEEMHFERSYRLSLYPGGQQTTAEIPMLFVCGVDTWPLSLPGSIEEKEAINKYFDETCLYNTGDTLVEGVTCSVYTSGYVASAVAIKVGRFLKLPFSVIYQMGRLGNLLLYCMVMALAIAIIPVGKRLLLMIGLMPTSVFMASCYSYDPTVIAFTTLGLALLIREMMKTEEGSFSMTSYVIAMLCFIWGICPKAVYAPIVLAGFAIPSKVYKSNRQKWIARAMVVIVFLILMSSFVLPTLLNPSSRGDERGGAVNVGEQMKNIFGHPISFTGILIKNIWVVFSPYILFGQIFTMMGHWGGLEYANLAVIVAAAAFLLEGNWKKDKNWTWIQKFWVFLGALGCVVLIWTAFYLTFTEVGKTLIGGVQARYFLPVLFPFIYLLKTDRIQIQMTDESKNMLMTALSTGFILIVIFLQMLVLRSI